MKGSTIHKLGIFTLALAFGTFSCETIIDVDIPKHEPALVLNSFFGTDTTFIATLHESKDILDNSYEFKQVSNATIELYADNTLLGTFTESENGFYFLDIYPEEGVEYSIIASGSGYETVEARDIIPVGKVNPTIEKVETRIDEYGGLGYQLTYSLNDPQGEDYYEVLLFIHLPYYEYYEDEDTSYHYLAGYRKEQFYYNEVGPEVNEFEDVGDPSIFSDELFNNRKHTKTIGIYYYHQTDDENSQDNKVKFSLDVRHISKSYYRYKISRRLQQDVEGNPFAEAAPVFNNIEGGYGIFAGYTTETIEYEYDNE